MGWGPDNLRDSGKLPRQTIGEAPDGSLVSP
jgi:hypothetical protein